MDALGGIGELVRATQFIGQSSGIYNGTFVLELCLCVECNISQLFPRTYLLCTV